MKTLFYTLLISAFLLFSCEEALEEKFPLSFSIVVTNPYNQDRTDVLVHLPQTDLAEAVEKFNPSAFVVLDGAGNEIASQFNTLGLTMHGIVAVLDELKAGASEKLTVRYHPEGEQKRTYPKRTQAELSHKTGGEWQEREYIGGEFENIEYLRVPAEHKDHSWYLRYEGPGWESEKVGYRLYLDQRNAIDIFGKKVEEPVLQLIGHDGFSSYHEMQDWGMDVFKVANSLGVGSLGMWVNDKAERVAYTDSVTCAITQNEVVYSSFVTSYFGWKTASDTLDIMVETSIHAGSRLSRQFVELSKDLNNFCTGIIKDEKARVFRKAGDENSRGYVASYGKQSLNDDLLGIAVFFKHDDFMGFDEDSHSHIVKLMSTNRKLEYHFLGAWEGETGGIKSEEAFVNYLEKTALELANPLEINIREKTEKQ